MANFPVALLSLGKFIGVMSPDDSGVLQWTWFTKPKENTFTSMLANREFLGQIFHALLKDVPGESPHFGPDEDKLQWEQKTIGPVDAGLIWNEKIDEPLRIGLGALGKIAIAGKEFDLSLLARMLKFTADGNVSSELGHLRFTAGFPVPDFLQAASLKGEYDNDLSFSLTAVRNLTDPDNHDNDESRVLDSKTGTLVWDVARIAAFVLRALVRKQAQQSAPAGFFRRMDDHFFPMLGEPKPNPLDPFPVFDDMGSAPDFGAWPKSILPTEANGSGALTFLWHLRALITGNSSPNILGRSRWFPLISGPYQPGSTAPDMTAFEPNKYPPNPLVAGAWLGVRELQDGANELVLDVRNGQPEPQGLKTIILLHRKNGSLTRPLLPTGTEFTALTNFLQSLSPLNIGGSQITFDAATGKLTLLRVDESGAPTPNGAYSMHLLLRNQAHVAYRVDTPIIGMEFPPDALIDDPKELFGKLVDWILNIVAAEASNNKAAQLAVAIGQLAADKISGSAIDSKLIFTAFAEALSAFSGGGNIEMGPLSIGVNAADVTAAVTVGPIQPGEMEGDKVPFSIGKATLSVTLGLNDSQPFRKFKIQVLDLRLASKTNGSGLVASLIPDMRDVPGFRLSVAYDASAPLNDRFKLEGGGKIPIQQTLGPLDVVALLVDVRTNSLTVGIDLSFHLAIIKVSAYELGVRFKFDGSAPEPFLHGLGLSLDAGGIKLTGMFAEIAKKGAPSDYVGGAVVSIVDMFQLSAIGAYTEVDGDASLFIFAALIAPLGGPPWFFITGIAGGFGLNRTLPPSGLLTDHPFIKVMRGEIPMGTGDAGSLATISALFAAKKGQFWVAAGIQFTAFGFINGKVIVSVQFGKDTSFQILGLASFGISPIAYFELALSIVADEKKFLLQASISSNSYIIHPDIFSLRGGFALGIWYTTDTSVTPAIPAGDFILSIGGYHPAFRKPDHYPDVDAVGVKCIVFGFVRLSVTAFFACTPQALMAGASLSLSAHFAGIGAGLDVYVDVLITWDPFHLKADMGVTVWFEFFGRHEIGVDLEIYTPPFGGKAVIDLALVSFTIRFGSKDAGPPAPLLHEFMSRQLGTPAERGPKEGGHYGAIVQAFNTGEHEAGLFKIDVTWGRTTKKQSQSSKQEGLDNKPIPVNAEFGFVLITRLPLKEPPKPGDLPHSKKVVLQGDVHLPLCDMMDLVSDLTLEIDGPSVNANHVGFDRLCDHYPAASFGDERLGAAQADDLLAQMKVAMVKSEDPTIALTDGIEVNCEAYPGIVPPALVGLGEEDSLEKEEYPLPLGSEQPVIYRNIKSAVYFESKLPSTAIKPKTKHIGRRKSAREEVLNRTAEPLFVFEHAGDLQRLQVGAQFKGLTYTVIQPEQGRDRGSGRPGQQTPVMPVPKSPVRRAELLGVRLRVTAPRGPIRLDRGRLEKFTRAKNFSKRDLTDERGTRETFTGTSTVEAGKARMLELRGGQPREPQLQLAGHQTVRVIFQGGAEDFIGDRYVTGNAIIGIPRRARRITLIGEGMHPPITESSGERETFTSIREALGVEHDTTLLALGHRAFAGHGCVFVAHVALPFGSRPMDSVPGFKLLRAASNFTVYWPAVREGCLILTVEPVGKDAPASALNEVRWLSAGADLSGLSAVSGPTATALVMDITAAKAWALDVDLGVNWRLTGVVVVQKSAREMSDWLRSRTTWDLVDDRLQLGAEKASTDVLLEVKA